VNHSGEIKITQTNLQFSLVEMNVLSFTGVGKSRHLSPVAQSSAGLLITFFSNDHRLARIKAAKHTGPKTTAFSVNCLVT
jgi:hypothetical protein